MKIILFAAVALAIGSSAVQAEELAASPRAEGARFAAMSLTDAQGARAIISNVLATANGTHLAPCQVQVSFFGADGSLIGNATTVQLKAGESTSVPASHPSKLVRAVVSIGDVVDPAKVCALRTSVEIFDVQTDTTFVSVPASSSVTIANAVYQWLRRLSPRARTYPVERIQGLSPSPHQFREVRYRQKPGHLFLPPPLQPPQDDFKTRALRTATLRDAAHYVTKLPKAEHETEAWQAAMEALSLETCMTAAFEIREIGDDDWPKWSRFFAKDFPGERPTIGELVCKNSPIASAPDTEKYGYVLTAGNDLRGVVLTIPSVHEDGSERHVFINISSWYVQPPFRGSPCQRTLSARELPSKYHLHESLSGRTYDQDDHVIWIQGVDGRADGCRRLETASILFGKDSHSFRRANWRVLRSARPRPICLLITRVLDV